MRPGEKVPHRKERVGELSASPRTTRAVGEGVPKIGRNRIPALLKEDESFSVGD